MSEKKKANWPDIIGTLLGSWFGLAITGVVYALPVKLAWNHVVPAVLGAPALTYWQAACVCWLAVMLIRPAPASVKP